MTWEKLVCYATICDVFQANIDAKYTYCFVVAIKQQPIFSNKYTEYEALGHQIIDLLSLVKYFWIHCSNLYE